MAWLFERTVEVAAWVALVVAWVAFFLAAYYLVRWFGTLQSEVDYGLLKTSAKCAGACVGFALGLGGLACVDRFLYDADE